MKNFKNKNMFSFCQKFEKSKICLFLNFVKNQKLQKYVEWICQNPHGWTNMINFTRLKNGFQTVKKSVCCKSWGYVIISAKQSMRCRKWIARQSYQCRFVKFSLNVLDFRGSKRILENTKTLEKFEKAKNMIKFKNEFLCKKRKWVHQ